MRSAPPKKLPSLVDLIWFLKVSGNTTWDLNRDPGRCQPRVPCPCRSSEWRYNGPSSVYFGFSTTLFSITETLQATFFRSCFYHISGASAAIGTLLMGIFTRASSYFPVRWKPTGWPKQAETGKDMLFVKPSNPTARSNQSCCNSLLPQLPSQKCIQYTNQPQHFCRLT